METVLNEEIEVLKIEEGKVTYSGSAFWDGCLIECFPRTPKIGERFNLATNFNSSKPPVITENHTA